MEGGDLTEWFEVIRIEDGLWAIREPHHEEEVISYLIHAGDEALLVDTGMGIGDIRQLTEELTDAPIRVVNTHSHYDHVGDDHRFSHVAIHKRERSAVERGVEPERVAKLVGEGSFKIPVPEGFVPQEYHIRPASVDRTLSDGDKLSIGELQFEVLHTPGHSPGSICLWEASKKWLFSGDTIYCGPLFAQLPHSDLGDYVRSMSRLCGLAPRVRLVLPGHGETPLDASIIFQIAQGFQQILEGAVEYWYEESPQFGRIRVYQFEAFSIYLPE
jgi:glyoxylase-like metal-dependent hydrolase (beta-lactamase superfamily II)